MKVERAKELFLVLRFAVNMIHGHEMRCLAQPACGIGMGTKGLDALGREDEYFLSEIFGVCICAGALIEAAGDQPVYAPVILFVQRFKGVLTMKINLICPKVIDL